MHLSEKSHRGMLLFVLFVLQSRCEPRGGHAGEDRRRLIFYPLSCVPQSGEALSPAICLPALGIVIPKYRPVNISLVTATSLPLNTSGGKIKKERCSSLTLLLCPFLCLSLSLSDSSSPSFLHPPEAPMHNEKEKASFIF